MRIAIISDIHGNLPALEAALTAIAGLGADRIHNLGDVVGYGPEPAACIALVRERATISLLGNHDAATVGRTSLEDFNEFARWAVEWTAGVLDASSLAYLGGLPYLDRDGEAVLVHATPGEPEAWHYIHGLVDAAEHFRDFGERVCFVGHSHRPGIFTVDLAGQPERCHERETLRRGHRYLVNAGSVGQPRDRDPRASFALYDTARGEISLHRAEYPVFVTQERMRAAGLPGFLVDRLAAGV